MTFTTRLVIPGVSVLPCQPPRWVSSWVAGSFPLCFSSVWVDQRPAQAHVPLPEEDAQAEEPRGGHFQNDP